MLITDRFVMLNFPKTGSTFARAVLKELYAPRGINRLLNRIGLARGELQEVLVPEFRFRDVGWNYPNQHGFFMQIPRSAAHLPVMSVMRDPLERVVSVYEFRHWARHPGNVEPLVREAYPHFPDLSFEEYLDVSHRFTLPSYLPEGVTPDIGALTYRFIMFFARDPLRTLMSLGPGSDLARDRDSHFPPITFLHTENLSRELHDFLLRMGYPKARLAFILDKPKENTTTRTRPQYLNPSAVNTFLYRERFFYQLFPEYAPTPKDQG